jgi:hypothetical protein
MKNAAILFLCCAVCSMAVTSCKKENQQISNRSLVGKWKLSASAFGTGGPAVWYPVSSADNHYVQFYADGKLGGNEFAGYCSYTVKDSLLTFNNAADGIQKYLYTIIHDTLTMTPNGPRYCIEGCAIRFIKQ